MLTPYGKAVRRYRDRMNANLKEMAEFMGVPSSYLSALEHGQKKVPDKVLRKTYEYFQDFGPGFEEWVTLAEDSPTHIKLDLRPADALEREVYQAVGRKFKNMPHNVKEQIRNLLLRGSEDGEVPGDRVPSQQED